MPPEQRRPDIVTRYAERLKSLPVDLPGQLEPSGEAPPARTDGPLHHPAEDDRRPSGGIGAADRPATESPPTSHRETAGHIGQLKALGFVRPDAEEKTLLSEQFRLIKRPLIHKALARRPDRGSNANMIMVTSAQPAEGKTFTAVNLALSIASERDVRVLLIDTDVYSQSVAAILGAPPGKGLLDLLLDEHLDFADILQHTGVPNLTLVSPGTRHPQATELLSSQRMVRLTQDIASRYSDRIVIIDSPPVLASTEATVLASHVGQIVMVVEHNRTGARQVERALQLLDGCTDISFVLNKVDAPSWNDNLYAKYQYHAGYGAK